MVEENLLSVFLLEKFSNLCFDAKGTHVRCAGFEATHDYGGWQAIGLFKCLDHRAHFLTYLNAILAIWFQSLVWIRFFFLRLYLGTLLLLFSSSILSPVCYRCHCNLTIGSKIPLFCSSKLGFFLFCSNTSYFYQHYARVSA